MKFWTVVLALFIGISTSYPSLASKEGSDGEQAPPAVVQPIENVIRWSTASEVENFGYDVFRGPAEEGPFTRVNEATIPGHGTTDVPNAYEYRDTAIQPDTAYWYYVESISLQGEREKFTPVFRAKPKSARPE